MSVVGTNTLKACVGQNMRTEKKLAPLMNVITSVRTRVLGAWLILLGNMGYLANLASHTTKATSNKAPMISGAST